jgi:prefoldin alpha subunit
LALPNSNPELKFEIQIKSFISTAQKPKLNHNSPKPRSLGPKKTQNDKSLKINNHKVHRILFFPMTTSHPIKLDTLQLQDLVNLKKRVEGDYQTFVNSFNGFKYLTQKFDDCKILVKNINEQAKDGDEILVPLTNSLFVPGTIASTDEFMVELGTGYYAKRSSAQVQEYCTRKTAMLKTNCEKLQGEIDSKRSFIEQIQLHIQKKAEAQQAMAQANAGKK